ncbi:hypothetical protein NEIFLAOT_01870 [Neisseria flavescens NRL30031/H210]|uniref:Uncharacterized protein n=1 Tax=Neisseria flavescens NRL30031/H210 TaxID=546264 RepID=C0EPI1_NEIFL|nr:hypothetical protein NEIFLAOT_01870 [Neisseria flavescens NRL30031/H210]
MVFFRVAAHVGQGAAEGGGAFVGLAAGEAVVEIVAAAALQLVEDSIEITAVGSDGLGGGVAEGEVTPIGPEVGGGGPCDNGTDDGVDDADGHGVVHVQTGKREAGQGLDGDEEGGEAVFVASGHEEQGGAGDDNPELGFNGRGEVGNERTDNHAENRTGNALVHAAFGGGVVGLADEKGGQQNPVAEIEMKDFDNDAGRGYDDGEAGGMAEDAGVEIDLAEDSFADIAELGVFKGGDAGVSVVVFGKGRIVLQLPQLVIDAAEVVEQAADIVEVGIVGMGLGKMAEGLAAAFHGAAEAFAVCVGFVVAQGGGNVAARLALHFEQAADAEDEVGVFELFGHFAVIDVGGADAFVHVLRTEVVAQHFGGTRMAVLAAQSVEKCAAALVEGGNHTGVAHGQVDLAVAQPCGFVGVEKVGFGIEVVAECVVGIGDGFLDGAVGQDDLEDQDVDAV